MKIEFSGAERDRFGRIADTLTENYRAYNLFASYLSDAPEFVTAEMMDALTSGGDVDPELAFALLLSALFGLDTETNADDRRFERRRIIPAVKRLDAERYRRDPYYTNIKFPDTDDGNWSFKNITYPAYRGFIYADQAVGDDLTEIPAVGFFDEDFTFPAVLEDGNEWMTLTPVDVDTCQNEIAEATGKVVTFGLGLGYYTYMVSNKPDVTSVTVIERSEAVIRLFKTHILPQFPNGDKVRIICADAFEYAAKEMPAEGYDYAFVDTWRDASDGLPMYMKMRQLEAGCPGTKFAYWVEGFILSRMRSLVLENIADGDGAAIPLDVTVTRADQLAQLLTNDVLRRLAAGDRDIVL